MYVTLTLTTVEEVTDLWCRHTHKVVVAPGVDTVHHVRRLVL